MEVRADDRPCTLRAPAERAALERLEFPVRTRWAVALTAVLALAGCSDGSDDATSTTGAGATATACRTAFQQGHDDEAAGIETFVAFGPSVKRCATLAEWTTAAKAHGAGLEGQGAVFVDRTCSFADDATKARPICQEVKGEDGKAAGSTTTAG